MSFILIPIQSLQFQASKSIVKVKCFHKFFSIWIITKTLRAYSTEKLSKSSPRRKKYNDSAIFLSRIEKWYFFNPWKSANFSFMKDECLKSEWRKEKGGKICELEKSFAKLIGWGFDHHVAIHNSFRLCMKSFLAIWKIKFVYLFDISLWELFASCVLRRLAEVWEENLVRLFSQCEDAIQRHLIFWERKFEKTV